jgi:dTDP-4-amino-4,6-dideoxygalactose transaminase
MKRIESINDLAINGATPAFNETIHVGYPNIGSHELFIEYTKKILESGRLTNNGPMVQELEQELQEYLGVKHCIAMCNGTIALECAISALDINGEVIIPSFTFIATAQALLRQKITPVFGDIDPVTHNLDPEAIKSLITPRTQAILGVHLWGRPADVTGLQQLASEYGIKLIYDAAHAFGCTINGNKIGNFGCCEVMSFHATKYFNTFEGGAVVTNDDVLADKIRLIRNFGFCGLDRVIREGTNGKMTEICAAMGLTNLKSINQVLEVNQENYNAYKAGLKNIPGIKMLSYDESEKNNYQYIVVEIEPELSFTRDEIIEILKKENIRARKYFWPGCHGMELFKDLSPELEKWLPYTKIVAEKVIVLPTGTSMNPKKINCVISVFKALLQN